MILRTFKTAIILILVFCAIAFGQNVNAQTGKPKISRFRAFKKPFEVKRVKKKRAKPNRPAIVSFGVMNGRAIDLVTPFYPPAAKIVRAEGTVNVVVVIDESGNVIEAKAVTGHILLRAAAVIAARQSKFVPVILNNVPTKVSGSIAYNFTDESYNWLEIGYILGKPYNLPAYLKSLAENLSSEPDGEQQLLRQAAENWESKDAILQTVVTMLEGKLSDKPRDLWLLRFGMVLSKAYELYDVRDDEFRSSYAQKFRDLLSVAPENINKSLILQTQTIVELLQNFEQDVYNPLHGRKSYKLLSKLTVERSFLGN